MKLVECELTEALHIASQYLAAAAKSYLPSQKDDSHLNFGWNLNRMALVSRDLNSNGLYMALNYSLFRIEFLRNDRVLASKPLTGCTHREMIDWLNEVFRDLEFEGAFKFDLHYDLPYGNISDDFTFEYTDKEDLMKHATQRDQAYRVLTNVVSNYDQPIEVRTWPHHFDTGAVIPLGGSFSLSIGLAIPDSNVDDFYYYVSSWEGHKILEVNNLPVLKHGYWLSDQWKGAVLESSIETTEEITAFFKESIDYLK